MSDSDVGDCRALRVTGSPGLHPAAARTLLLPFDRPRRFDTSAIHVVRPRRWLRFVRRAAIDARPFGGLFPGAAGTIDLLPYQLEPALAMVREGFTRVLIADAVGLGKTIQAGLIVRQLSAECESFRALVVVPAALRDQWATELATRFDVHAHVVTSAWLTHAARELPGDVSPWALPGIYISSFEFIRRPEVLRPLEDTAWDLLVIDEAHAATAGTARHAAVHGIALRSRRVVSLTATPHAGDHDQFRALCRIGRSDTTPDPIVLFRRTRSDVGIPERRRTALLPITLSEAERRTHRLLERYTDDLSAESRVNGNALSRLLAIILRKRALSSLSSLAVSCKRRLVLLAGQPQATTTIEQLSLPLDDDEMLPEDDAPEKILGTPGLSDISRERSCLEAIVTAAERAAIRESKVTRLKRLITKIDEPVIVFTEYRDTLARLYEVVRVFRSEVLMLHGGMTARERSWVQREFNTKGTLLLATDTASEGLNLQHRCRTVVHFELPWSPARLAQRTGRVDRIGQSRRVHEIMLVASDTAERLVLAPLTTRAARAGDLMSSGAQLLETVTESQVASAILDGMPLDWQPATFDDETMRPRTGIGRTAVAEAQRIAELRRWIRQADSGPFVAGIPAVAMTPKQGRLVEGIVRLCMLTLTALDGAIVHRELVAMQERRPIGQLKTPADVREFLAGAELRGINGEEQALRRFKNRIGDVSDCCTRVALALSRRESVVCEPSMSSAQQLVQRGLFDRRRERASEIHARAGEAMLEESSQRVCSLKARSQLTASLKLHAILLIGHRHQ